MLLLYLASLFRVDAQPKTPWRRHFTCLWLSWEKKMQARKEKGLRPPLSPRTATTSLFRYPSDHVMVKEKVCAWGGCWQSGLAPKKGIFMPSIDLGESLRRWRKQCSSGEPFFFSLFPSVLGWCAQCLPEVTDSEGLQGSLCSLARVRRLSYLHHQSFTGTSVKKKKKKAFFFRLQIFLN